MKTYGYIVEQEIRTILGAGRIPGVERLLAWVGESPDPAAWMDRAAAWARAAEWPSAATLEGMAAGLRDSSVEEAVGLLSDAGVFSQDIGGDWLLVDDGAAVWFAEVQDVLDLREVLAEEGWSEFVSLIGPARDGDVPTGVLARARDLLGRGPDEEVSTA